MGWEWHAEHPPRRWAPPRGTSRYGIAGRNLSECGSRAEAGAVRALGLLIRRLETAADDQQVASDRKLAALVGLPLSTVQGFRTGAMWPSFPTLAKVAQALGFRVVLGWTDQDWKTPLFAPAAFEAVGQREEACPGTAERARLWHDVVVAQLRWMRRAQRQKLWEVAADADTHPDVVSKAEKTIGTNRWVSVPVLSALAFAQDAWLAVDSLARPFPPPVWAAAAG